MFYIETDRLILKKHEISNSFKFNEWYNDKELFYLDDDEPEPEEPETLEETEKYLKRLMNLNLHCNGRIEYAIHLKESNDFIGFGQIVDIDSFNKRCYVSITIGEKRLWGNGFGKEVMQAVVNHCFTKLCMNRIGAEIFCYNKRSVSLFESIGFTCEGKKKEYVFKNGIFHDELNYILLKRDWKELE